jgi:hypothetical protein
MTAKYDAILIGSGIGALTVAVGLARCAVSSSNRISILAA